MVRVIHGSPCTATYIHTYIYVYGYITCIYTYIAVAKPSYGELIDMLDAAETEAAKRRSTNASILLLQKFKLNYRHISIGRPERFYDTVCRIAAPTRPSLRGPAKLLGSPLVTYRRRTWVPSTRKKEGN